MLVLTTQPSLSTQAFLNRQNAYWQTFRLSGAPSVTSLVSCGWLLLILAVHHKYTGI